jgi:4-amino-4-deoxy-L-arabinose transferase-like glycosyltransferase
MLAVVLYLFLFRHFTVGGNYFQDNMLVGSSLAEAFCIWAFVYLLKNKYLLSGSLCGLAALFQPLIGLQVASIIGLVLLVNLLEISIKLYN